MKWLGAVLIIISTACIGLYMSHKLEQRPKLIRHFESALHMLEAEIIYSQLPLHAAFQIIAKQLPAPLKYFFNDLSEDMLANGSDFIPLWERAVEKLARQASFKKSELEIIKQFGYSLGQHDYQQQQNQIRLTLTHLDRELKTAYEEQAKYSKLSKTLGVLSGIFIILLLI